MILHSRQNGVLRRIALSITALLSVVLLGACRVDSVVTLGVEPNGTGTLAVVTTVDAEVVARVPNIAQDLSFEDAKNAGWKVSEVGATEEGGLQVRVAHSFANEEEATVLLSQLSGEFGPFKNF